MRLVLVPLFWAVLLLAMPAAVFAITNQGAAEKLAENIGQKFPSANIDVSYQNGKVLLKGSATPEIRSQVVNSMFYVEGVQVTEVNDEINIVSAGSPEVVRTNQAQMPVPMPSRVEPPRGLFTPKMTAQQKREREIIPQAPAGTQTPAQRTLAPYPNAQYPAAYGQPAPQYGSRVQQTQYQAQAQHAAPPQAAQHPEAYGPQGPLPGQYNQPNLPQYAWPAYANYPNYSQVAYPKQYSPRAWPYIGPFYPYPQVPLGWRKVTMENHDGWWWLDFDDGNTGGPLSPLFRQPQRYTY